MEPFKSCPSIFGPLYTIHIKTHGEFIPIAMVFLPDRQEITYHHFLGEMKAAAMQMQCMFAPQVVHTDFEMAMINAVQQELGADATKCLFHYTQSIYRKV